MPTVAKQSPLPSRKSSSSTTAASDPWGASDAIRMLLYGQSGTGKTTMAATFPGPIQWLICSGGNRPGELRSVDTPEYRKKIHPFIVSSSSQMSGLLKEGTYATRVLDHASGYCDLLLKELLGVDELPAQKGWGLASQQTYGTMALQAKETFRAMLNLPCNVVIIAQERTFGGRDDGMDPDLIKPVIGAAMSPSVVGWLNPACDYVVQTFKRQKMVTTKQTIGGKQIDTRTKGRGVEYAARIGPHETFTTKFRVPREYVERLPEAVTDPTYQKLVDLIAGKK